MVLPRAGRSIDVTFLAVPFLKMALQGGRHVEALKAERADEAFLRRIPVLTVLCCSSRRVRHRLRLLRDVLQEIHLLGKSASHPWFEGEVGLRPPVFHFHRKMTEEGVAAAEAGRSAVRAVLANIMQSNRSRCTQNLMPSESGNLLKQFANNFFLIKKKV